MQGIPATFDFPTDSAEFRHPVHRSGVELYRAHIVRHAFEPHTHAAFGLGAIEQGAERFRLRGVEHLAPADSLVLMNPDELHTGRAETEGGWRYRMIYLDADVAAAISGEADWWFADAVRVDVPRARQVTALLDRLWRTPSPLAFDGLLVELLQTLPPHVQRPRPAPVEGASRFERVVDYLHAHLADRVTLEQLAAVAHLSPFHFLRCFRAQYHATPQQLLMALRLQRAKRLLAAGVAPVQVSADCGLADQAHLTRAFAWRYGVTPARYQRQLLGQVSRSAETGG
jgi:AraC-like DNA-binding protein